LKRNWNENAEIQRYFSNSNNYKQEAIANIITRYQNPRNIKNEVNLIRKLFIYCNNKWIRSTTIRVFSKFSQFGRDRHFFPLGFGGNSINRISLIFISVSINSFSQYVLVLNIVHVTFKNFTDRIKKKITIDLCNFHIFFY
jgi:hypothetical protein